MRLFLSAFDPSDSRGQLVPVRVKGLRCLTYLHVLHPDLDRKSPSVVPLRLADERPGILAGSMLVGLQDAVAAMKPYHKISGLEPAPVRANNRTVCQAGGKFACSMGDAEGISADRG